MKKILMNLGIVIIISLLVACSSTVLVRVPPNFTLEQYGTIGVIVFSSEDEPGLEETVTQKFIQVVQQSQPGTVMLELGDKKSLIASSPKDRIDAETLRMIGDKHGVDAVMTGVLKVSETKARVKITNNLTSLRAKMEVQASLSAKMYETGRGATVWTASRSGRWPLASISGNLDSINRIGVSDRESKFNTMISQLVYAVTEDFRPTHEKQLKD
jgi:hypothetical protein